MFTRINLGVRINSLFQLRPLNTTVSLKMLCYVNDEFPLKIRRYRPHRQR